MIPDAKKAKPLIWANSVMVHVAIGLLTQCTIVLNTPAIRHRHAMPLTIQHTRSLMKQGRNLQKLGVRKVLVLQDY